MRAIEEVAEFMRFQSLKLVTAESCTAGLIASTLADLPGAGQLLDCAFVVYSPDAKKQHVSVRAETLATFNLTSEQVAREMAEGALVKSRATLAVSNTGVTDDIDSEIPAGTQCFAWAFRRINRQGNTVVFSETRRFSGDRASIRQASAIYALERIPYYVFEMDKQSWCRR